MPRYRREIHPGELVHLISRFADGDHRLTDRVERGEYLRRLGRRVSESDWTALSYALMSTHIHLALIAGEEPFENLFKSVHAPFAWWLNRRQGRRGQVFADRPHTFVTDVVWLGRLVAYLHNNPRRAGVARSARGSTWTSHRAYVDPRRRPSWLSVEVGLTLMDFRDTPRGRRAFDLTVAALAEQPRDPALIGDPAASRREIRERVGAAVCIAHPTTGPGGTDYAPRFVKRWKGDLSALIPTVAEAMSVTPASMVGSTRARAVVDARRVFAGVGRRLGVSNRAIGLEIGVSETAVRKLVTRLGDDDDAIVRAVVAACSSARVTGG